MTTDLSMPTVPAGDAESVAVLDGNAAAGEFADLLAGEPTTLTIRCGTCGAIQAFAQLRAYLGGPGTVLRCRECEGLVARVARTPRGTLLDISGANWLLLATPA